MVAQPQPRDDTDAGTVEQRFNGIGEMIGTEPFDDCRHCLGLSGSEQRDFQGIVSAIERPLNQLGKHHHTVPVSASGGSVRPGAGRSRR